MQALYRNRLIQAYLGATRQRQQHAFTGFDPYDDMPLKPTPDEPIRPASTDRTLYHVINASLNVTQPAANHLDWQRRKAALFTFTQDWCGSAALGIQLPGSPPNQRMDSKYNGYCRTEEYAPEYEYEGLGITLGRAMALSGAAASPNMGFHTSPLLAFVMAFFNIRLGGWLPNTRYADRTDLMKATEPRARLNVTFAELFGQTGLESSFVHVSDGGHFDNLGLYEMVRKRCTRIVVVDASCDPKYEFDDLERAIRLIRVDFGIRIEFLTPLPKADASRPRHFSLARIIYEPDTPHNVGYLIYIKPVLDGDEPLDLQQYATKCRQRGIPFPHHATSDQFFDEVQFESYRQLGALTASEVLDRDLLGGIPPPPPREPPLPPPPSGADRAPASGMLAALHPATLAMAALAVGGTIGVAGTVTLSPSEISLSATDRALLARSAAVELRPSDELRANGVRLNAGEVTVALADVKARLAEAAGHLKTIAGALDKPALRDGFELVARRLESVDSALRDARALAQVVDAMPLAGQQPLAEVRRQLAGIEAAIRQLRVAGDTNTTSNVTEQTLSKLGEGLGRIEAAVKELNATVKEGSPRRNVQGPEGARR